MKRICLNIIAIFFLLMFFSPAVFAATNDDEALANKSATSIGVNATDEIGVTYRTHIQNDGWETRWATDGTISGTYGRSLRLEGIQIQLTGNVPDGARIEYRTHVENEGWEANWRYSGGVSGSEGKGQRLEGIQIRLVNMPGYSVEYRTHVQNVGWEKTWSADEDVSGTYGQSLRLEGIQIRIVKSGADLTEYNKILTTIENTEAGQYTVYSWEKLKTALETNIVSVQNSQDEVDTATAAIEAAYNELESLADAVIYSKAGTYGLSGSTTVINQDVIVQADGVILQNMQIKGNLIISEAVKDGAVTLNNVTVEGKTYVRGGGENSIHINGGDYNTVTVQSTYNGKIRIVATNAAGLDIVVADDVSSDEIILEGTFDTVLVDAPKVKITSLGTTVIKKMTVSEDGAGSTLTLETGSRLDYVVLDGKADIKGKGRVVSAYVNADSVTYELEPESLTVSSKVKIQPKAPDPILVTSINVTSANNVTTVAKGSKLQMTATVKPTEASNPKITWSVTNGSGAASISSTGLLTAETTGIITVKATATDGSGKVGEKMMTVNTQADPELTTVTTIEQGKLNPDVIIKLAYDTFTTDAALVTNWTGNFGTTELTIGSVTRDSTTQVTVHLTGTAKRGDIKIQAKASALSRGVASNEMPLTVPGITVTGVSITGNAIVGSTLTAVTTPAEATVSYKWQRADTVGGTYTDITGATADTYKPVISDEGKFIKVTVTGTGKYSETVISTATSAVAGVTITAANDGSIVEGAENNEVLTVTATNDTFVQSKIDTTNITMTGLPEGITVGSVGYIDSTHITITLSGNSTKDYDENIVATVQVAAASFTNGGVAKNASVTFIAVKESALVTPTAGVVDDANNTFGWTYNATQKNATDYEYSVDGGTTWTICTANPQTGISGAYAAGKVQVRAKATLRQPASAALESTAPFTLPTASITVTTSAPITESAESGKVLNVTLSNDTLIQAQVIPANVTLTGSPTGVTIGGVSYVDATHLNITLSGNATGDYDADINVAVSVGAAALARGTKLDTTVTFTATVEPALTPPTSLIVDDANNWFNWTNNLSQTSPTDYEYSLDSGATWKTCDAKPQTGIVGAYATGTVHLRTKATVKYPASAAIVSGSAFTPTAASGLTLSVAAKSTPESGKVNLTIAQAAQSGTFKIYYRAVSTDPSTPNIGDLITPAQWIENINGTAAFEISAIDGKYVEAVEVTIADNRITKWGKTGPTEDSYIPPAPAYTIDYANERTVQNIPNTVEYDDNNSFSSPSLGTGAPITLVPGTVTYFRVKAIGLDPVGLIQTLTAPARLNAPTSNVTYSVAAKTVTGLGSTYEYSISGGSYTTTAASVSFSAGAITVRTKATASAFASSPETIGTIAAPASAPIVTLDKNIIATAKFMMGGSQVTTEQGLEYSINGTDYIPIPTNFTIDAANAANATVLVRTAATESALASVATGDLN
ncbi:MAG: Ig-like domain-containing protein [Acetobacterium woodii]|nr:Ig-like domain-containing protein [Acetobacterium woodii]